MVVWPAATPGGADVPQGCPAWWQRRDAAYSSPSPSERSAGVARSRRQWRSVRRPARCRMQRQTPQQALATSRRSGVRPRLLGGSLESRPCPRPGGVLCAVKPPPPCASCASQMLRRRRTSLCIRQAAPLHGCGPKRQERTAPTTLAAAAVAVPASLSLVFRGAACTMMMYILLPCYCLHSGWAAEKASRGSSRQPVRRSTHAPKRSKPRPGPCGHGA